MKEEKDRMGLRGNLDGTCEPIVLQRVVHIRKHTLLCTEFRRLSFTENSTHKLNGNGMYGRH